MSIFVNFGIYEFTSNVFELAFYVFVNFFYLWVLPSIFLIFKRLIDPITLYVKPWFNLLKVDFLFFLISQFRSSVDI